MNCLVKISKHLRLRRDKKCNLTFLQVRSCIEMQTPNHPPSNRRLPPNTAVISPRVEDPTQPSGLFIAQESSQVAFTRCFRCRMCCSRQLRPVARVPHYIGRRVYSTVAGCRAQETRLIKCNSAETQTSKILPCVAFFFSSSSPSVFLLGAPVVSSNCRPSREDVYPAVCWHCCLEH